MRKLMWFTIGFAAAGGLCVMLWENWLLPALLLLGLLSVAGILGIRRGGWFRFLPILAAGFGAGLLCFSLFDSVYLSRARELNENRVTLSIAVADYSYDTDYGIGVDGILHHAGRPYQIRAYLDGEQDLSPGDRITGTFLLRVTTREGLDSYHPGKGIFLVGYARGSVSVQQAQEAPWWCFPAVLRQQIRNILRSAFPEDVFPFVQALLLGDSYALSYETDTALKISGIRHIVAVSGLHVSILYGVISILALKKRWLVSLVGLPALLLFAAVAGFTPSVCRACVMIGLMMLSKLLDREYDAPTALSFAVLLMLLVNPMVITSAGFQLSVSSVAGILWFQPMLYEWFRARLPKKKGRAAKLVSGFGASVSVSVSAMSLTVPLSALYFRTVSLIGVVSNFLMLWLVELAFVGILLTCVLFLLSTRLGVLLGGVIAWLVRGILWISGGISRFPLAAVYTQSPYVLAWLIFTYLLIAAFLLTGRKRPGRMVCLCALGLCLALSVSWAEPLVHGCSVTMLDVGQGQCILLQSGGKNWLVDCGGAHGEDAADLAAETLLSQGITCLDGVIVTHYDADHFDGVPLLLTRLDTELLLLPDTQDDGKRDLLPEISGETLYIREDTEISFGSSRIRIYGPVYSGYSNENSLCVLFDTEKCDILITGDRSGFGERMLLRGRQLPDVDILVAGHHGAGDSTTEVLLETVRPEIVLISVASDNPYGHPHRDVLARLENFGCRIYRTDQCGTITYRR